MCTCFRQEQNTPIKKRWDERMVNIELQGSNLSKFCRKLSGESMVNNQNASFH